MAKRRNTANRTRRPPSPHGSGIVDRRAEFERLTRASGRDETGLRAFIEGKIALVRSAPNLTAAEKKNAIAELQRKLEHLAR